MSFKIIETQEELDKVIAARLLRQKESLEEQHKEALKAYDDYESLKTRNAELETQVGDLQATIKASEANGANHVKELEELNAKVASYETANLRTRIAIQHGLPYEMASRLVGDDEASIAADAKQLAGFVGAGQGEIPPLKNPEPPIGDGDGAYKSLLENLNIEGE